MSVKLGNTNIAGTQVLYSTTGNNTDGAMTQAAVTTALNNKADNSVVNLKANDNAVVHLTSNETISGEKLFTSEIKRLATLSPNGDFLVKIYDNNGKGSSGIISYYAGNGIYNRLISDNSTSNSAIWIDVMSEDNGYGGLGIGGSNITINNLYPDSTSDTSLITQAWINGKFQVVSALPASPDSRIFYFIPE